MKSSITLLLAIGILFSCNKTDTDSSPLVISPIAVPSQEGAAPNLFVNTNGQAFLSWVEYLNDSTDALWYSRFSDGQ